MLLKLVDLSRFGTLSQMPPQNCHTNEFLQWAKTILEVTWIGVTLLDSKVPPPFSLTVANPCHVVLLCLCSHEHLLQRIRVMTPSYVLIARTTHCPPVGCYYFFITVLPEVVNITLIQDLECPLNILRFSHPSPLLQHCTFKQELWNIWHV